MIDWNGKLEAVHTDGRVMAVQKNRGPDAVGDYGVYPAPDGRDCFRADGSKWIGELTGYDTGWTIRNVAQPIETPTPMEFGAEIKVDGVRPEWLEGADWNVVKALCYNGDVQVPGDDTNEIMNDWEWKDIRSIYLPADHPHYQQNIPTPDERAVAPELVERMRKLVEKIAANAPWLNTRAKDMDDVDSEARAIVAALEPVDPEVQAIAEAMADVDRLSWDKVPEGKAKYDCDGLYREDYLAYARAIRTRQLQRDAERVRGEG